MYRILIRIYLLTTITLVASTYFIRPIMWYVFADKAEAHNIRREMGEIFLLQQYLDTAPPEKWQARFDRFNEARYKTISLVPLKDFRGKLPPEKLEKLKQGQWVANMFPEQYYRLAHLPAGRTVSDEDQVMFFRGIITPALIWQEPLLSDLLLALLILLPVAVWSHLLWRDLRAVSKAALEFGEGKLSRRAKISRISSMRPLAESINQMAERIENLISAHRELLHSVSHELRTPIARLEFGFELLKKSSDAESLMPRIDAMKNDLTELNELVNELLHLARLDQANVLQKSGFHLKDVLRQSIASTQYALSGKQVEVHIDDRIAEFNGDPRMIDRAVGNILRNAAKYAACRISLSATASTNGIRIAIDDDGPGIPESERERVFEPFYRMDRSRDRATGGYGLGLAIALKAVKLHGGSIHVEASRFGGARFVIDLPARRQ